MPQPRTEIRTVTVEDAVRWLEVRADNRPIKRPIVSRMARDIRNGDWKLTHQGIAFDTAGRLIDGQHRLSAIIQAGTPVTMMLSWDLEDGTQLVMDDHSPRSGRDALIIESGVAHIEHSTIAILQIVGGARGRFSKPEMSRAFDLYGDAAEFVLRAHTSHVRGVTIAPVLAPAAKAWFTEDRDRIAEFIRVLATGIPTSTSDDTAALRLRDWLISNRDAKVRPTRTKIYQIAQNSLRNFLGRKDVKVIRGVEEDLFPLPEGLEMKTVGSITQLHS